MNKDKKLCVGILFGGRSSEKEVSFAGGRTVYDNLDRNLYEPIPLFITAKNEFIKLKWEYIYKGSIKDFYPNESNIGEKVYAENLKNIIDIAFLVLHGLDGEDGHIQGLLEWFNIPYTGSKMLGSVLGISKFVQKEIMQNYGYSINKYKFLYRYQWEQNSIEKIISDIKSKFKFPFVVKSANQGSSIGVSVVHKEEEIVNAIDLSLGLLRIKKDIWNDKNFDQKYDFLNKNINEKHEYDFPVYIDGQVFNDLKELIKFIDVNLKEELVIESEIHDNEVIIEDFIEGREFSCIVLEEKGQEPKALFPTEIIKVNDFFDYRSKYLLGLTKKVTPMDISEEMMNRLRSLSVSLFKDLHFNVFARIEGFVTKEGDVIFNDANTISGMEQISVLFQQASYVNLSPKQLLTFIINNSL